jgi:hypothetical protein
MIVFRGRGVSIDIPMSQMPHAAASHMKGGKARDCDGCDDAEYLYPAGHFMGRCALSSRACGTVGIGM